jgi:hypothetical protein
MYTDVILSVVIVLLVTVWAMKLIHVSIKIILTVAAILLILNYFGYLADLNEPLNNLIVGSPEKICGYNTDCALKRTQCNPCDCGDAVYRDWAPFCILHDPKVYDCKPCPALNIDFQIACIDYKCVKTK